MLAIFTQKNANNVGNLLIYSSFLSVNNMENANKQLCTTNLLKNKQRDHNLLLERRKWKRYTNCIDASIDLVGSNYLGLKSMSNVCKSIVDAIAFNITLRFVSHAYSSTSSYRFSKWPLSFLFCALLKINERTRAAILLAADRCRNKKYFWLRINLLA